VHSLSTSAKNTPKMVSLKNKCKACHERLARPSKAIMRTPITGIIRYPAVTAGATGRWVCGRPFCAATSRVILCFESAAGVSLCSASAAPFLFFASAAKTASSSSAVIASLAAMTLHVGTRLGHGLEYISWLGRKLPSIGNNHSGGIPLKAVLNPKKNSGILDELIEAIEPQLMAVPHDV